jgi:uncharacterized surface protein with fasciclin (FAS1) repeats
MKLYALVTGIAVTAFVGGSVSAMEVMPAEAVMQKDMGAKCLDLKKAKRADVRKFQRENGIHATGFVGKLTKAKLLKNGCSKVTGVMKKDIVDTAVSVESLSTLVAAVQAADLVATLKSAGPFTVFAPNNAAFAKLPAGTVEGLLKAEKKADLAGILTYHVVAGAYTADKITDGLKLKTVNGKDLTFSLKDGKVMINGSAVVISANVDTANGVVHVIDSVLLP